MKSLHGNFIINNQQIYTYEYIPYTYVCMAVWMRNQKHQRNGEFGRQKV